MLLPGVALFVIWKVAGPAFRERLDRWRSKKRSGSRSTLRWIVGIIGFLVSRDAVTQLFF